MEPLRLPAEWEPQGFVLLAWPSPEGDFAPWLEQVEDSYRRTVVAISRHQDVVIVCEDGFHRRHIRERLGDEPVGARVHFVQAPYQDVWVRDTAPLAVFRHGKPELADFRFNGWGGKYPSRLDDALGVRLHRQGVFDAAPYRRIDWVLEGGSVETDGRGTLLATRSSIQNPNRNPDPEKAEAILRAHLGLRRFLWLDHGHLEGDDTDGHIDTLARFCDHDTIVYQGCDDPADPHYEPLQAMAAQLRTFHTPFGRPYELLPLPLPRPIHNQENRRLPASYANFLIINGAVLVPQYDDPADPEAVSRLKALFPQREIIPIPARALIHQYGSLHCMTMNYPQPLAPGVEHA
ncbi:agmatine deiminase [Methylomarinovum caldicuralii]|uniref:Agmatine deiminase n=1 Tax=Methylomarinovum caldicuralii TaxID=438856 RepID=A0AAU9CBF8_9GAMM|nr:agmatine deiminase family protein [Methylomarinovum caldicuralii]BCX82971.1 agmatine deiminase [Methylomarinovum caldicuralii]